MRLGTCWESWPEMKLCIVHWLPQMKKHTPGHGTFDDLRSPLKHQAFWRQTWLIVYEISINCSRTSVWGLGRSGKDSRVKLNSEGYRLFPLWSDTCQCCETVETGKECLVSSLTESSRCPRHRHLLLPPRHPSVTMKPLCSDCFSSFTASVIDCWEINHTEPVNVQALDITLSDSVFISSTCLVPEMRGNDPICLRRKDSLFLCKWSLSIAIRYQLLSPTVLISTWERAEE